MHLYYGPKSYEHCGAHRRARPCTRHWGQKDPETLLVLAAPVNPSMRTAEREAAESAKAGRKGFNNGWSKMLR